MKKPGADRYRPAMILTISLFFLWGMANNLNDILIAQFRRAFTLSDFETSFVQQVFYLGYFLLAIPAAMVARERGYKSAIVLGLLLYALGALLFYPAAQQGEYRYFLVALFVIACGLAFLETAANPLMTEFGDPTKAARRLNLAQAANPVGTVAGVLIGKYFILSDMTHNEASIAALSPAARSILLRSEVQAVQTPYLIIGLVVLGFAIAASVIRFPGKADQEAIEPGHTASFRTAFRRPQLIAATIAQFFYVGAQVGLWSYTIRYAEQNMTGMIERDAADYLFASLVLFGIGRFVGTALMSHVTPPRLLRIFAMASLCLSVGAAITGGQTGLVLLVATSFFMSIQFPTIFALGVSGLGPLRRVGASLIVMAVIGGAVLTGAMGFLSDRFSINAALCVPALAFLVVIHFAMRDHKQASVVDDSLAH
ncbi:Fucose permease [Sphingobium indicum BiD32]|uniref:Fucose permease n=1 Tax=Sphingobium indicum BiD32 TaxID=1301087 RepID=N1MVA7_9SPHN|nr:L-fucose:H+ symporter permease [Sphingobium indicum]CCW19243.1 Fucose permease [Sphingobium indicum BiD32]